MKRREIFKFVFFDTLSSISSWILFFMFRKTLENQTFNFNEIPLLQGMILIPFFWIILYTLFGKYQHIFRASRLEEFYATLSQSITGSLLIFFILIIDDIQYQHNYSYYYYSISFLFFTHFSLTFLFRYILTSIIVRKIKNRNIGFNTIIIGSSQKALKIFEKIEALPQSIGNKFIGILKISDHNTNFFKEKLKVLGTINDLKKIIKKHQIEEVILAIESNEQKLIEEMLYELDYCNVIAKIIPNKYDLLSGKVKMSSIHSIPLTEILPSSMSLLESFLKRLFDVIFSILLLILLTPIFVITSILVKLSSNGPIFYFQKRAGKNRKPFNIIKFRSMYINAENHGKPMLTQENDNRITKWGKIMRKYRIDELPQFFNVLIGDMSLVGPRPEREYFIERIMQNAPHYKLLFKIRPGITSWGMVKYGYANSIQKMIKRLKYDIIYMQNLSIFSDIKVMAYTLIIIIQGRGK